jgi:DNA invertase Pin-like site-specific DNA recombinase
MTAQLIAYARTSHKTQSLLSQENELKKYAEKNNFNFDAIYTDEGVSGMIACIERNGFSRCFDRLRSGDTLIVWWIDRLGRDYHDSKETAQQLMRKGITIKTVNQNMEFKYQGNSNDMMVDMMLSMLVGHAAAEKENRRASQDAGREALKVEGAVSRKTGKTWEESFKERPADTERNEKIAALLIEGMSIRKIADTVGCNASTVQRVKKLLDNN